MRFLEPFDGLEVTALVDVNYRKHQLGVKSVRAEFDGSLQRPLGFSASFQPRER